MQKLKNKTCIVTGAVHGIDRAIAAFFQNEGAVMIIADIDEAIGPALAAKIGCRFEPLDVREKADWTQLGGIVPTADVVADNAGVPGFEADRIPDRLLAKNLKPYSPKGSAA